ncbi:MAG: hypothetical protein V3S59_06265 [Alphaproteobacteria bacterium]
MKYPLLVPVAGAFLLAGCAGAVPWNSQVNAGITRAEILWCESKNAAKDTYLCEAEIVDGKETADVTLTVKLPNGAEVRYAAKGVKAFEGHEVRGAVEKAISNDMKDVAPGVVESVVDAILGL